MDCFASLAMTVLAWCSQLMTGSGDMKQPAVYIMASKKNGTVYTGVTSDIVRRVWQHREGEIAGFSARYGCKLLVWFELHETMTSAILREKQIKAGSRAAKGILIGTGNPEWRDLYDGLF